jgi:peptidoglycan hydrolase-like protein with peptidoglycan-binding domain
MKNNDVKRLQQLLATDSEIYPEGLTTGYFGNLTQKAVQRFQEKYNIATAGDPGYGYVGPKTRAKLAEVFSAAPVPSQPPPETSTAPAVETNAQAKAIQEQIQGIQDLIQALQAQIDAQQ